MGCWFARPRQSCAKRRKDLDTVQKARETCFLKEERDILKKAEPTDEHDGNVVFENIEQYKAAMLSKVDTVDLDRQALEVKVDNFNFPFENLVFEGGGNKGIAYVGVVKFLEDKNLLGQIKRFGGSSAGAITATLVAPGYNSGEILRFLSDNIEDIFLDHQCGYMSLLPNLVRTFGWNPGNRIFDWFGDKIKDKNEDKDPDYTFYDLWRDKKIELCIVVTNLNLMCSEYCHTKTTPDMPIREALRMTMSIPVVFSARAYNNHGQKDYYVDGGLLCNYPIHCYDGWYLSMARGDEFLSKFQSLKDISNLMMATNRFGSYNPKTLGFLLFSDGEREVMRYNLEKRYGCLVPSRPTKDTKLYRQKQKAKSILEKAEKTHVQVVKAVENFLTVLHKHNKQDVDFIDKEELRKAFNDPKVFTREQADLLFGKGVDVNEAFEKLDQNKNGRVSIVELVHFIEERGIRMKTRFIGYQRREVNNLIDFMDALQNSLLTNMKYIYVGEKDEDRTVGINTGHIETSDYNLEPEDQQFAVDRGYNATETFLRYYVAKEKSGGATSPKVLQGVLPSLFSKKTSK